MPAVPVSELAWVADGNGFGPCGRGLGAVDVALPCLRQPAAARRRHELRHGHQQGTRREPGRRTAVGGLQREFDDRDRRPGGNGGRVDRRDQRPDGPDLLLGQRAAVADDHRSARFDARRRRRPCGTDTPARAGRAGGSGRPGLAIIACTTGNDQLRPLPSKRGAARVIASCLGRLQCSWMTPRLVRKCTAASGPQYPVTCQRPLARRAEY